MFPQPKRVACSFQSQPDYGASYPYHASQHLPESPVQGLPTGDNQAYLAVRHSLALLGLDQERYGTSAWNPLGAVVCPGDRVLVKPNLIADKPVNSDAWECLITHGAVLRAVVDYVLIALQGRGSVVIADAPQEDSDMARIQQRLGLDALLDFYRRHARVSVEFLDLRNQYRVSENGVYVDTVSLPGDPRGNVRVNLGARSHFAELDGQGKRYYGAYYDLDDTNARHSAGVHEYMISRTALEADVFISVPKLKTHKKVGLTLNLKGLVGINGHKNWLPHYAVGAPEDNGDQFPSRQTRRWLENALVIGAKKLMSRKNPAALAAARWLKPLAYRLFGGTEEVVRSGNWHGNDTCWRMVLDLNRVLFYADVAGQLPRPRKRFFSIVDGIVAMEGNGPVAGRPCPLGLVAAGFDPVAVDAVCAALIGFDYRKLALLREAFSSPSPSATWGERAGERGNQASGGLESSDSSASQFNASELGEKLPSAHHANFPLSLVSPEMVQVISNRPGVSGSLSSLLSDPPFRLEPHFGWKGFVESGS